MKAKPFLYLTLLTVGSFFISIEAQAQKESKQFSIGIGIEGSLPMGDASNSYSTVVGPTIRLSYHVGPGFATLTSGVVLWLPKIQDGYKPKVSVQIPIRAGYKYVFYKPFFAMAEVGYSSFKVYTGDDEGQPMSTNLSGFTYSPAVGVNLNAFELGLRYEGTSLSGGTLSQIGLRLGFNF